MSEIKLTRENKIAAILDIMGADPEHRETIQELFGDLSDNAVDHVYDDIQALMPYFSQTV